MVHLAAVNHSQDPSILDIIHELRRGLFAAAALAVVAGGITWFVSSIRPPVYRSSAAVFVPSAGGGDSLGTDGSGAASLNLEAYADAIASRAVRVDALARSGSDPADVDAINALDSLVDVVYDETRQTGRLRIVARAGDPARAAERANALADSLLAWDRRRSAAAIDTIASALAAQVDSLEGRLAEAAAEGADLERQVLADLLRDRQENLALARALQSGGTSRLEVIERAAVPLRRDAPRPVRDALVVAVLAFVLGHLVAFAQRNVEGRFRSLAEFAGLTGKPILGVFAPSTGSTSVPRAWRPEALAVAEAVRAALHDRGTPVILVVAPGPDHGTSAVATELASAFARSGDKALLIDGAYPGPHQQTRGEPARERSTKVEQTATGTVEEMAPYWMELDDRTGLEVLPAPKNRGEGAEGLLARFGKLLDMARGRYDAVVVSASPLDASASGLAQARHVDGVILAVSMRRAKRAQVERTLARLENVGATVLGTVATDVTEMA